jgi:hypothetical protein
MSETELVERLERLERARWRLKRTGLVAGVVAVVVLGIAHAEPNRGTDAQEAGPVPGPYPTRSEVVPALKDADYALRRFQEVTGQINFGRWNLQNQYVDARRDLLEATLAKARDSMARIDAMQSRGKAVSGLALFEIYDSLVAEDATAGSLSSDIDRYDNRDVHLATDLANVGALAIKTAQRVEGLLFDQIQAEESELEVCRSAQQKR